MIVITRSWKMLLLFCLGLAAGSAFCMKWIEGSFWSNGNPFTILGLELFYSKEEVSSILTGLDDPVKNILQYHLSFDFAFMAGIYPTITSLCMIAKGKTANPTLKKLLYILAYMQLLAWAADITENYFLFKWISEPGIIKNFTFYHLIVWSKWIIAIAGLLFSLFFVFRKNK